MDARDQLITQLREQLAEKVDDKYTIESLDRDRDAGVWRLASKILRQRAALDILNRKVTTLHFALRVHEQVHGPLTREEYMTARKAVANEAHRERIEVMK